MPAMSDDSLPPDPRETRRGIQSVEVGFALLQALARSRGQMPLKKLAEQAGMSASKAHLYLVSYIRLGLVTQDPVTSRYGLGATAVQLGMAALNQMDLVDVARGVMHELQTETGLFVSLSVWGNRGPTIVDRIDGDQPAPMSVQIGFVLPLLTTATGRVFMAHLPRRAWQPLAQDEAARNPAWLDRALADLDDVRRQGFAQTRNLTETGYFGVSGPIIDGMGQVRAAVTCLGPSTEGNLARGDAVATAVTGAARRISAALGRPDPQREDRDP